MDKVIKKIIHIDMDAFFAAVEARDNPRYRNKPLIIGGRSNTLGVVSTCSYEARKYGIHSAMPTKIARKLCPHGIFISGNMEIYKEVSSQMMKIFKTYTDIVEPLSFDEAFLDVTQNKLQIKSATKLALIIQKDVQKQLNLTCSCGISYNKFLAKSATEVNKPNGFFVITPEQSKDFLDALPIQKFYGIGKQSSKKMISLGIYTGKDLRNVSLEFLTKYFNTRGLFYYNIVRGIDSRNVEQFREIKSISKEKTFYTAINNYEFIKSEIEELFNITFLRFLEKKVVTKTVTLKIKYSDFEVSTKSFSMSTYSNNRKKLLTYTLFIFDQMKIKKEIRLLGISFSNLKTIKEYENSFQSKYIQLSLNF